MSSELKRFGARVRELRLATGMSQEDLASKCGLHRTYVGGVERGERNVGLLNIHAIARALGVHADVLMRENPKQARSRTKQDEE
jgi:transcriptional regulator with XRE-family HTH domain